MPDIDSRRATKLVLDLMPIPGPSGKEGQVARFIRQQLRDAGVPARCIQTDSAHQRTPTPGEVGNLILKLEGTQRGPRRMFSAHMDTVPICVGTVPQQKGRLVRSANPETGLGADDRAGCAVILNTVLEIRRRKLPHPPLTFCWFVQEEVGLQGARVVSRSLLGKPRLAFNWDGGSPTKLTVGATGGYRLDIDVRGIASHAGGAPEWGVSAVAIASLAIADLQRRGWHGLIRKGKSVGTSNVGYVHGGEATNVVTDAVELRAEARSHDPAFRGRIVEEFESAFTVAAERVKNVAGARGSAEVRGRLDYESFRLPDDAPCIVEAERVIRALGAESERTVANGGVDANWTTAHGIPTVTLGCGQLNQHMTSETLDLDAFHQACRIALALATAAG